MSYTTNQPDPEVLDLTTFWTTYGSDVFHLSTKVDGEPAPFCRPGEIGNKKDKTGEEIDDDMKVCKLCVRRLNKVVNE